MTRRRQWSGALGRVGRPVGGVRWPEWRSPLATIRDRAAQAASTRSAAGSTARASGRSRIAWRRSRRSQGWRLGRCISCPSAKRMTPGCLRLSPGSSTRTSRRRSRRSARKILDGSWSRAWLSTRLSGRSSPLGARASWWRWPRSSAARSRREFAARVGRGGDARRDPRHLYGHSTGVAGTVRVACRRRGRTTGGVARGTGNRARTRACAR
jgi:hypothetical protein